MQKILIIDDNQDDRIIIKDALSRRGLKFEIAMAPNGEAGIEKAKEQKPDLAIIDTNLTGIDGFETCRRLKEISGLRTKTILITGYIEVVDAAKARAMGADDCCVKTSDYATLSDIVKNFLTPSAS